MHLERSPLDTAPRAQVTQLLTEARSLLARDPRGATALLDEAEALATRSHLLALRMDARIQRATARLYLSDLEGAQRILDAQQAEPTSPTQAAQLLRLRAILLQRQGDPGGALVATLTALRDLAAHRERPSALHVALHQLTGTLLTELHDAAGAIEHFGHTLTLLETLPQAAPNEETVASLHHSVGLAHRDRGETEQALAAFHRALRQIGNAQPTYLRAMVLGNVGRTCTEAGQPADAIAPLSEALSICRARSYPRGLGTVHHLLGLTHLALGELEAAEFHLREALRLRTGARALHERCETLVSYARLLLDQGRDDEALLWIEETLHAAPTLGSGAVRAEALFLRHRLHHRKGALGAALHDHVSFHEHRLAAQAERADLQILALTIRGRADLQAPAALRAAPPIVEEPAPSLTDPLTGVANRRMLDGQLQTELLRSAQRGRPVALARLDLDRLKTINDRFGRAVGDRTLQLLASHLQSKLRAGDMLARVAGDEFILLFPGADATAAHGVCERLRIGLQMFDWATLHPQLLVTASFGVADNHGHADAETLLARADAALQRAMGRGRNRVESTAD